MAHVREQKQSVVFIASEAVLSAWRGRAAAADEVISVSDASELDLLELIARQQPQIVVLEEGFACTDRGAALIGRLRTTPMFQQIDIRVLWSEQATQIHDATMPLIALATPIRPSYPTVRRAARRRVTGELQADIDGCGVIVVDLSAGGAQVLSSVALHADQRVHIVLADSIPIEARVVWVVLEMSPTPRYRAGIEFLTVDAQSLSKLLPPS